VLVNPIADFRFNYLFVCEGNMKNFFVALLAALSFAWLVTVAEAGGGSKNNGQIKVINDASNSETLVVFLNSGANGNSAALNLGPGTTIDASIQSQFNAQKGHSIAPGSSFTFTGLAAGNYSLTAEFLGDSDTVTGVPGVTVVHVNKGQTVTVTYTGDDTAEPSATVSPSSAQQ
jgi:hypothetical protein